MIGHEGSPAILLDTGQGFPAYVPLIKKALEGYSGISDIILSHHHHDHILGLADVIELLDKSPRIHKFPCKDTSLDKPIIDLLREKSLNAFDSAGDSYLYHLRDEQEFRIGPDASLRVLHTPGHTEDSASFLLLKNDETALFTADTVLGSGSAVFNDLRALIRSLERCIDIVRQSKQNQLPVRLFCGHGPVVEDGEIKMREYIEHRMQRERQVVQALQKAEIPQSAKESAKSYRDDDIGIMLIFISSGSLSKYTDHSWLLNW